MTHYQEVHNLKQELKRNRMLLIEQKNHYEKIIASLRREILRPKIDITTYNAEWTDAMRIVCQLFDTTPDDVYSLNRVQHVMYARHTFNYLCRKVLRMSFLSIGRIINRDHSTVINSVNKTQDLIDYDKQYAKTYQRALELLGSNSAKESLVIDSHIERRERYAANKEEI